jgi:hypothetical protein
VSSFSFRVACVCVCSSVYVCVCVHDHFPPFSPPLTAPHHVCDIHQRLGAYTMTLTNGAKAKVKRYHSDMGPETPSCRCQECEARQAYTVCSLCLSAGRRAICIYTYIYIYINIYVYVYIYVSLSLSHTHTHTLSLSLTHTHSLSLSLFLSLLSGRVCRSVGEWSW